MKKLLIAVMLMVAASINAQDFVKTADYEQIDLMVDYLKSIGYTENVADSSRLVSHEDISNNKDGLYCDKYICSYFAENPQTKATVLISSQKTIYSKEGLDLSDRNKMNIQSIIFTFKDKKPLKGITNKILGYNRYGGKYKNQYIITKSELEFCRITGKRMKSYGDDYIIFPRGYIGVYPF